MIGFNKNDNFNPYYLLNFMVFLIIVEKEYISLEYYSL